MDYRNQAPAPIRQFLTYLETIMNRSPKTVNGYFLDLRTFFRFLIRKRHPELAETAFEDISIDTVDLEMVKSVTLEDLYDFLMFAGRDRPKHHKSAETTYGNTAGTRARKVSALRSFFKYMCDKMHFIEENPARSLEAPRIKKSLPKHLTLKESVALLEAVGGEYKERDFCMLTLLLNCGLRVSELAGINLSDISEDRLRVLGKGNKERVVYLNDACLAAIKAYLPVRIPPKDAHRSALFVSRLGNRISVQTIKHLVGTHLGRAGLGHRHFSTHKLRHTAATLMYQNGVDIRTLKEVLGHENLGTTQIYTHVVDENLKEAARLNPLAAVKPRRPKE